MHTDYDYDSKCDDCPYIASEAEYIEMLFDRMYYPIRFNAELVQKKLYKRFTIKKDVEIINILWRSYVKERHRREYIRYSVSTPDRLREMAMEFRGQSSGSVNLDNHQELK